MMVRRRGMRDVSPAGYSDIQSFLEAWAASIGLTACRSGTYVGCPDPSGFARSMNAAEQAWFSAHPAPGAVINSGGAQNAPGGNPSVSFQPSRSGTLFPGDSFVIKITGGAPNAPVIVNNNGQSGQSGTTDASGNWSMSGTWSPKEIGTWNQSWSVGGAPAGSYSFVIASPTAGSSSSSGGQQQATNSNGGQGAPGGQQQQQSSSGGGSNGGAAPPPFSFSSIPWWGWMAAAGVAFFAFGGKH
jgi:hypothetical protein